MKRANVTSWLLLLAFAGGCGHAAPRQAPSATTPTPVWPALELRPNPLSQTEFLPPRVLERRLANGIRVLVVQQRELPVVQLCLLVRRGAADTEPGVARLAAATFFSRIKSVPGTRSRAFVGYDAIGIEAVGLTRWGSSSNLPDATFSALVRMLRVSELEQDLFERERRALAERNFDLEHDIDAIIRHAEHGVLYPPEHPYHFDINGDRAALDAATRANVERFFREQVQPDQLVMVAVGDVAVESFVDSMNFNFSSWSGHAVPRRALPEPIAAPPAGPAITLIDAANLSEAAVAVAARGVPWNSSAFTALFMLNTLLGNGLESRLNMSLRESAGLAYSPYSKFEIWRGAGPFLIEGKVDVQDAATAISKIADELARLRDQPIDEHSLSELKQASIRRIPLLFGTLSDTLSAVSQLAIHERPADAYDKMAADIERVTAADISSVAREHLSPSQLRWTVIAPANQVKQPLERLNLGEIAVTPPPK